MLAIHDSGSVCFRDKELVNELLSINAGFWIFGVRHNVIKKRQGFVLYQIKLLVLPSRMMG